jgi:hypothetical protein
MAKQKEVRVYQIKITLKRSRPPIWRRVLVTSDTTLSALHRIVQSAMGWHNAHLHLFEHAGEYYAAPRPDGGLSDWALNVDDYTVGEIFADEGQKVIYQYDLGDSWKHIVLLEKILPLDPQEDYPVCIKGRRACPPEEIGGTWGYEYFLEALQDPQHPDHDEYMEWGAGFDPETFDLDEINEELRKRWP